MDKIQEALFLPMDWESARPELVRKQFELARAVNQGSDGRLYPARTLTAAATMNAADGVLLCDASAGAFTVSALEAGELVNKVVYVKKIDAGANPVLVKAASGNTIEGAATRTLAAQYDTVAIYSSGGPTLWRL